MWKKYKMHSVTIADWLWMNFLRCFGKCPDLCCTKPSQEPSDIGNCLQGESQNCWQTNTGLFDWRLGKSFWDTANSMDINFSAPSLLEMKLGCTWREKTFQPTKRWRGRWMKGLVGNYFEEGIKINILVHQLHWEEWWLCRKIAYICTYVTR